MNINKFYGTQKWSELYPHHLSKITAIQDFFQSYVDENGLVITSRFNGTYLSIRFCGLEVLQLSKNEEFCNPLCFDSSGKIRRNPKKNVVTDIAEISPILDALITQFLQKALTTGNTKARYSSSIIPGFSFEHWLESLIMSDTKCGRQTRGHINIHEDKLENIINQIPVIIEKGDMKKRRAEHIDIMAAKDGTVSIIELKKNADIKTALVELEKYHLWATNKLDKAEILRGNLSAMVKEGYLPPEFVVRDANYRKVMVLVGNNRQVKQAYLDIDLYILPPHWLLNAYKNQNLFL